MFWSVWRLQRRRSWLWRRPRYLFVTTTVACLLLWVIPALSSRWSFLWWWGAVLMVLLPTLLAPPLASSAFTSIAAHAEEEALRLTQLLPRHIILAGFWTRILPAWAVLVLLYGGALAGFLVRDRRWVGPSTSHGTSLLTAAAVWGLAAVAYALAVGLLASRHFGRLAPAALAALAVSAVMTLPWVPLLLTPYLWHSTGFDAQTSSLGLRREFRLEVWRMVFAAWGVAALSYGFLWMPPRRTLAKATENQAPSG